MQTVYKKIHAKNSERNGKKRQKTEKSENIPWIFRFSGEFYHFFRKNYVLAPSEGEKNERKNRKKTQIIRKNRKKPYGSVFRK